MTPFVLGLQRYTNIPNLQKKIVLSHYDFLRNICKCYFTIKVEAGVNIFSSKKLGTRDQRGKLGKLEIKRQEIPRRSV